MNRQLTRMVLAGLVVVLLGVASVVAWTVDDAATMDSEVASGAALFRSKGCVGCHSGPDAPASFNVAPDLRVLPTVAAGRRPGMPAEDYIRESIVAPQVFVVPGFGNSAMPTLLLTQAEVDALVAYLANP